MHTFLILAAAAAFLYSWPVQSQPVCGLRQSIIDHLAKVHGEAVSAQGITSNGQMLEVLTSSSGSWTIIFTKPDGITCLVTTGSGWESIGPLIKKQGA